MILILSGEHCGNVIPKKYTQYFQKEPEILSSHRGYDIGSFDLFKFLLPLASFSHYNLTSRLLIEVNRSVHHKDLYSEFSKNLSEDEKNELLRNVYHNYRDCLEKQIKTYLDKGEFVLHLSVHSFTPVLNNIRRKCDLGLLFDPSRVIEKQFCTEFKRNLSVENPSLIIRHNYPYLGKADGFTTYLRKQFKKNYAGIELEVNQNFAKNDHIDQKLKTSIFNGLSKTLQHYTTS